MILMINVLDILKQTAYNKTKEQALREAELYDFMTEEEFRVNYMGIRGLHCISKFAERRGINDLSKAIDELYTFIYSIPATEVNSD